jgi:HK97 family phage major capsid protein
VRNEAILGRLTLRDVPFNVRISRETLLIGTAAWVGEGAPKPFGKGGYDFLTMPWTKAALIVAFTEELARFSDPSAERLMRDGLVEAISMFLDSAFISASPAVAGIAPAGILNALPGGQTFPSSGSLPTNVMWDLTHAMNLLLPAKRPAWLMNTRNATAIGSMQNALGQTAFPTVSATGGTLLGAPVVPSLAVPEDTIILIDQQMILHAADPSVAVDVSREATVNLDSAPTVPPAAGTQTINLWQANMIGLRAEKFEHWVRARDTSVVTITAVDYTAPPVGLLTTPSGGTPQQQPTHPPRKPAT